jgi:hypothetical protein
VLVRGIPGPVSRTHTRASPFRTDEPIAIVSPADVCSAAFWASCIKAWVSR